MWPVRHNLRPANLYGSRSLRLGVERQTGAIMNQSGAAPRLGVGVLLALGGTSALAADLPVKAAAAPPAPYNWTGIYAGVHAGYGMGMKDWTNSVFDFDVRGFLGGGQIGVNQQIGNWVMGIEADASWANIKGAQT